MKKCTIVISTIAWLATSPFPAFAGQPGFPGSAIPPGIPGDIQPGPLPTPAPVARSEGETNVTITVSRTIVNPPGAITIIGTAASEQEKQTIAAKLQEAAPGRTINNQLTVSSQSIFEPAGAERKKDKPSENLNDDEGNDDARGNDSKSASEDRDSDFR